MAPITIKPFLAKFGAIVQETVRIFPRSKFKVVPYPSIKAAEWAAWRSSFFNGLGKKKRPRKPWNQGKRRR